MKRVDLNHRDRDIWVQYRSGKSRSVLAVEFNMTRKHISNIIQKLRHADPWIAPPAEPYARLQPDAGTRAEIAAARLEAASAPPFKGYIGI